MGVVVVGIIVVPIEEEATIPSVVDDVETKVVEGAKFSEVCSETKAEEVVGT